MSARCTNLLWTDLGGCQPAAPQRVPENAAASLPAAYAALIADDGKSP